MSKQNTGRKFFATAATAALVASAIVPVASAAEFTDADKIGSWAKESVDFLADKEVIGGNPDGSFNPQGNITRAEAAKMFTTALDLSTEGTEDFSDITEGQWFYSSVVAVSNAGIVNGKGAGLFAPKANLTRAEAAKMIVEAYGLTGEADLSEFSDAKSVEGKWSEAYLATAVENGIIKGNNGKLAANDSITRQEFAVMFKRAIDASEVQVDFAAELVETLTALETATKALSTEVATDKIAEAKTAVAAATTATTEAKAALEAAVKAEAITAEEAKTAEAAIVKAETAVKATEAAIVKAEEAAKVLAVESVTAINASELVVKFSKAVDKATVIDADGTVVNTGIKIDDATIGSLKATLSEDGKTLTILAAGETAFTTGVHKLEIAATTVTDTNGQALPAFEESFRVVADTTRPEVTSVTAESKFVYTVKFSEPVTNATATAVTATYKDTNLGAVPAFATPVLSADGKTLTVTFASTTEVNEEINLLFANLADYSSNVAVPTTKTVTISDADKTKPVVSSMTATSSTTIAVKFSEAVTSLDASKIKFNGGSVTATVSTKDATVVNVTVPATTTSGSLVIDAAAVKDLSANVNTAKTETVYFTTDKTAPTLTSSKVVKVSGSNVLVLQFSEKVAIDTLPATLTLKYVDKFGVSKTDVTVSSSAVALDTTDATKVNINLGSAPTDVNYTIDFPAVAFEDLFKNDATKFSVSFLNNPTAVTTNKLELASVTPVVDSTLADRTTTGSAFVDVTFNNAVDSASAKLASNYAVEGATVSGVELITNTPATLSTLGTATVRVYITNETVELSGNYNVTVKGVKGYASDVTEMASKTVNVAIQENVTPVVKSAVIASSTTTTSDLTVTFSEAVTNGSLADFELFIDGSKATATISSTVTTNVVTVTVDGQDLNALLAAGKKLELRAVDTIDIADLKGNVTTFEKIELN